MAHRPRRAATGQALGTAAGALLLASTFLPWSGRGAGSAIALVRIADLVLSGRVETWVPRPGGLLVYAIPLGGALVLLGAGVGGRAGTALAMTGAAAAALGAAVAHLALGRIGREGWGTGAALAALGLVSSLGAVVALWRRREPRGPASSAPPPANAAGPGGP